MVLADAEAIHSHVTLFLPENLPRFTYIFSMVRAERSIVRNRGAIDLAQHRFWKMVEVNRRTASQVVGTSGGRGNIQRQPRGGPFIGMEVTHTLDMNKVFDRIPAYFFGGSDTAFGQ